MDKYIAQAIMVLVYLLIRKFLGFEPTLIIILVHLIMVVRIGPRGSKYYDR